MAAIGYLGLLDFVGYPVGPGVAVPTGATFAAGKRWRTLIQMLLEEERSRTSKTAIEEFRAIQRQLTIRQQNEQKEIQRRQNQIASASWAVFLAEI